MRLARIGTVVLMSMALMFGATEARAQEADAPGSPRTGPGPNVPFPGAVGDQIGSCAIPLGFPVGIEHNGSGNLLITDITDDSVHVMTTACSIVSSCSVAANSGNPLGVTTNGTTMWVTDTAGVDVDAYDLACNYLGSFSVAGQTTFPEGITYNTYTGNLWVVDGSGNNVFEYTTSGTLLNTIPIATSSNDGVAFNSGVNRYVLYDSASNNLTTYDSFFNPISAFAGPAGGGGEGAATIGASCFIVQPGTFTLFEYECFTAVPTMPIWALLLLATALLATAAWWLNSRRSLRHA